MYVTNVIMVASVVLMLPTLFALLALASPHYLHYLQYLSTLFAQFDCDLPMTFPPWPDLTYVCGQNQKNGNRRKHTKVLKPDFRPNLCMGFVDNSYIYIYIYVCMLLMLLWWLP